MQKWPIMTTHELAEKLKQGPNIPVVIYSDCHPTGYTAVHSVSDNSIEQWDYQYFDYNLNRWIKADKVIFLS